MYNYVKKNQLDAQLILSIFRQPLHVSGLRKSIIWRYNRTTLVPTNTTDSHLKRILSTNCCKHTVVPPDNGTRYAQNL